ncbi:TPA: AAA family ATPase [Pseudomonas aeruginosa]|uniref:AAA family ATPase n=1 Tax=Pseudomonas aeruginosa TaxID=287 RepID=UPI002291B856|nr:AAA family ATPase [Pseudomonas aeruginosa]HCW0645033.1 AAA family ATPase [Pseudomonas aeruginosa]HCW1057112.1 AAA family ATPase [Pseudomonas aeruginosa]HCW1079748.1 AAA family ATPase [Pseudomonas aeruginosa]
MTTLIEYIEIYGLYGHRNYKVELSNNQLILVGENGTGKSTIVSILYYTLTGQWRKLWKYKFNAIAVCIDGVRHLITKEDLNRLVDVEFPTSKKQHVAYRLNELGVDPEDALNEFAPPIYREINSEINIGLTPSELRKILQELSSPQSSMFDDSPPSIASFQQSLNFHFLYLPTYRRIERDLQVIFPGLEDDVKKFNNRNRKFSGIRKHLELVEFGMQDVTAMISDTMRTLENKFRTSLDSLTGGYLRVILRKEYEKTDISILGEIQEDDLNEILQKIDESVLSSQDQKTLRETIKTFGERQPQSEIDKLSAHIITKLILLHKTQYELETKAREFAAICNKYLKGKAFEFNSNNFTLPIRPIKDDPSALNPLEDEIKLSMLSSGEKQIVSLFSHLYLSDYDDYFIIIDEPELSLSVPWQKTFLTDITNSNKCKGLVAVTHSPFIYANDLQSQAHAVTEFLVP